ncbi:TPA: hemerythrin domain-containing protein [Legionella feeleii]
MSIYTYLKNDHQKVKELISKIEELESDEIEKRDKLFNELKKEIIIHSKAEEKIFYQPLKNEPDTQDEIPHAKEEHAEVEEMLERLSSSSLNGAAWSQLFKSMTEALFHHIEEEEGEIFTDAKKDLTSEEAMKMEELMRKEKKHIQETVRITTR